MDPRTVTMIMMITGAECSLLFFVAGSIRRTTASISNPPSLFWGLGTAIHVVGVYGLLMQGKSSPWFGIVFANATIIMGQLLLLVGVRRLLGKKLALVRYAMFWVGYVLASILLTFWVPLFSARTIVFSCYISAFYFEGAALCFFSRSKKTDPLAPAMAVIFGLLALFFLMRALFLLWFPQASLFTQNRFNIATFVVSQFGLIIWCLGLILMQNRLTEVSLEQALEDKDTLFRELQHRVKNSISVIAGLVTLESSRLDDAHMNLVLDGLQSRISAIAELYDHLFRSGDTGQVEMDDYLKAVAESLFSGQAAAERGIHLEIELENAKIDAKRAVPLGLITNELLTDSLKYAFPKGRGGTVRLALRREASDLILEVWDDGVGLPQDFSVGSTDGLGLILVDMLAKQVGGVLSFSSEGGARFGVRFPISMKS